MNKNNDNLTNVKENHRGRPAYPYTWPLSYQYTRAAMMISGVSYKELAKIIKSRTGKSISRTQLYNYFRQIYSVPPEIYAVLMEIFGKYLPGRTNVQR